MAPSSATTSVQCALGAIPLPAALATIREFLDDNPDEVVTLIIQDAISPAETADAFRGAGLDGYLHEHEVDTPWATLGELIDRGERLVVFAEDEGPPPTWYHQRSSTCRTRPTSSLRLRTSTAPTTAATPRLRCS
jgi:hypothetical protein